MNFSTKISIQKSDNLITYDSKVVLLGSCFSENIGSKFEYFKFQSTVNPFGIIFNPISIENLVYRAFSETKFSEKDIFFHDNLWKCYDVHSDLNLENKEAYLINLNRILTDFKDSIVQASHLIITCGTAWVYRNITSKNVVANCHKMTQNQFVKELLSVQTIEESIQNTLNLILKINPHCNIIFTISPVRHLKDGFVENQISKAHLIAAIHSSKFTIYNYFPSYEIIMDELRDYRFYDEDMLHPSKTAINYIWKLFSETYFSKDTTAVTISVDAIQKALAHRPFNKNSESYSKFLKHLNLKISTLGESHPQINFW